MKKNVEETIGDLYSALNAAIGYLRDNDVMSYGQMKKINNYIKDDKDKISEEKIKKIIGKINKKSEEKHLGRPKVFNDTKYLSLGAFIYGNNPNLYFLPLVKELKQLQKKSQEKESKKAQEVENKRADNKEKSYSLYEDYNLQGQNYDLEVTDQKRASIQKQNSGVSSKEHTVNYTEDKKKQTEEILKNDEKLADMLLDGKNGIVIKDKSCADLDLYTSEGRIEYVRRKYVEKTLKTLDLLIKRKETFGMHDLGFLDTYIVPNIEDLIVQKLLHTYMPESTYDSKNCEQLPSLGNTKNALLYKLTLSSKKIDPELILKHYTELYKKYEKKYEKKSEEEKQKIQKNLSEEQSSHRKEITGKLTSPEEIIKNVNKRIKEEMINHQIGVGDKQDLQIYGLSKFMNISEMVEAEKAVKVKQEERYSEARILYMNRELSKDAVETNLQYNYSSAIAKKEKDNTRSKLQICREELKEEPTEEMIRRCEEKQALATQNPKQLITFARIKSAVRKFLNKDKDINNGER